MDRYYLCMEIGGTNTRYGVITEKFQVAEFQKIATKKLSDAEDKGSFIAELFNPLIDKYGLENFICLSFSLASLMNRERSICFSSPNIKGFDNLPLPKIMKEKIGLPVCMERDVNTSLLYEIWKRQAGKEGIIIGVFIGTGLGNAMCIDGKVYKGSTGSSCELGHIPIPHFDEYCGCGKKGCIEVKAGGRSLAALAENKYHCPVQEIFKKHGNEEDVREIVYLCALATATEITILDPEYVILGGGVVEMEDFPLDFFLATIRENLRIPNPRESLKIIKAFPDLEAGIVGAALNAANIYC